MEIFKTVAPKYEVSTLGNVKSYWGKTPRILKPTLDKKDYLRVGLMIDGKPKTRRVHRLVATAFIPNPNGKSEVNHINGIKTDNRVENPEWCTPAENNIHAVDTGLNLSAKLTNADVVYVRENPDRLNQYQLAKKFGVVQQTISDIQRGKTFKFIGGKIRGKRRIPDDVRNEIRRLYKRGVRGCGCEALAEKFGVENNLANRQRD